MITYKLLFDLDEFWTIVATAGAEVSLQDLLRDIATGGLPIPHWESSICLTAALPSGQPVHVAGARIVLERATAWPDESAIRRSLDERAQEAMAILRDVGAQRGIAFAPTRGIIAVAGLFDDLLHTRTRQALWHYEIPDRDTPQYWRLVRIPATDNHNPPR
jgi:hypothetical protein